MIDTMYALSRPLLFALPPEEAHELTLKSLERGLHPRDGSSNDDRLSVMIAENVSVDTAGPGGLRLVSLRPSHANLYEEWMQPTPIHPTPDAATT